MGEIAFCVERRLVRRLERRLRSKAEDIEVKKSRREEAKEVFLDFEQDI